MRLIFLCCIFSYFVSVGIAQQTYSQEYMIQECPPSQLCTGCTFAEVGLLYWQANLGGLEFAFENSTTIDDSVTPKVVDSGGKLLKPDCSWDPGVRASIGYTWGDSCDPCACNWSVVLTGTYLHSKSTKNKSLPVVFESNNNQFLAPLYNPAFSGLAAETIKGSYELDFGTLDLLTRVSLFPCRYLGLFPNFGLRGAWINQDFEINNDNVVFITTSSTVPVLTWPNTNTSFNSQFRAIGIKAGLDFSIPLRCGFSLIGSAGGSLLYGHSNVKETINGVHQETGSTDPELAISHISIRDTICKLAKNCEGELGLSWNRCLSCFNLTISASYYFAIWFDQNDFRNFVFTTTPVTQNDLLLNFTDLNPRYGNLQLQGLILKTDFAF